MKKEEIYLILSDIHGNLSALEAVLSDAEQRYRIAGAVLLGDLIDYGMRSNEVIDRIQSLDFPVLANLWGNHEKAVLENCYERFSSERGRQSARYTREHLNESSRYYLEHEMNRAGAEFFRLGTLRCYAVHGSEKDPFWKSILPEQVNGEYEEADIVISGHSHYSHCFEKYYPCSRPETRNRRKVLFINPGSVGQPRNHNCNAQYAVLGIGPPMICLLSAPYDIGAEQALFTGETDLFYSERLERGI